MRNTFRGLVFRDFVATSTNGDALNLVCQTLDDARYTAAELLNEPVDCITVHHKEEW